MVWKNWRSAGKFPGCSGCLYWRASIGTDRRKALSECWEFLCTGSAEETGQGKKSRKAKERPQRQKRERDRKSTRLNSSHVSISYAVFCLKKKKRLRPPGTASVRVSSAARC